MEMQDCVIGQKDDKGFSGSLTAINLEQATNTCKKTCLGFKALLNWLV